MSSTALPLASTNGAPVIELRDVSFAYDGAPVIERASLTVGQRDFVCMVGPNGGGKSTLLRLMLGLLQPTQGQVLLLGGEPRHTRHRIGYMPQQIHLDPQFPIRVLNVVLMGRLRGLRPLAWMSRQDRDAARAALRDVGLEDVAERSFAALSGGQRQRVLIARALACEPAALLLDEPTANLDIRVEAQLYELLQALSERVTVLMVSHDVGFVSRFVRRVICVNRRVEAHHTHEINSSLISRLYGREMRVVHHSDRCCEITPEETPATWANS